jgi:hypothetical protein
MALIPPNMTGYPFLAKLSTWFRPKETLGMLEQLRLLSCFNKFALARVN